MSKHKGKNKRAGSVCPVKKPRANSKHENYAIMQFTKSTNITERALNESKQDV